MGHNADEPQRIDEAVVLDALPDMVFLLDSAARVVFANEACRTTLGLGDESLFRSALEFVHPDDVAVVASSMETISGKRVGSPIEFRVRNGQHGWQWVELVGSDCRSIAGVDAYVCVAREITERKRWEIAGNDVARFQHVFQHGAALTLLLDPDGTVVGANNALNRILGHDKSVAIGRPFSALATPGSAAALDEAVAEVRDTSHPVTIEAVMRHADADLATCLIRFELRSLGDDPALAGIVATGQDITNLQLARRELEHLVEHEQLTGLANRSRLESTLEQLLAHSSAFAVLFVDLDGFKSVNDRLGHRVGDMLLKAVGSRLASCVRPGDLVARTGGDEFVIVAKGFSHREAATRFARRLEDAIGEPYFGEDHEIRVRASIGVALAAAGSTVDQLIDEADAGMYSRKAARARTTSPN